MFRPVFRDRPNGTSDGIGPDAVPDAPPPKLIEALGTWAVHPIFLAAYPALSLYALNAREVRTSVVTAIVGWSIVVTAAVWGLLWAALRNARQAALVVSLATTLFFSVREVRGAAIAFLKWLQDLWVPRGRPELGLSWVLVPEAVFLVVFAWKLAPRLGRLVKTTGFLNVFAVALCGMAVAQAAMARMPRRAAVSEAQSPDVQKPASGGTTVHSPPLPIGGPSEISSRPDIYYIVLDGYARSDVMKVLFDFDNSAFLDRLERKGFYVARQSGSNYCQTPLCLSSALNACYVNELVEPVEYDLDQLTGLIGQNALVASLRPLGYQFVTFATGFDPTDHPEADLYLSPHRYVSEFERMFIDRTPLQHVWPNKHWLDPYALARDRIHNVLDRLPDIAHNPAPTFTLAHMVCPHPPFIFGENGEDVSTHKERFQWGGERKGGQLIDPLKFRPAYRAQSIYMTKRIEQTIDRILAESPEPPIIILQSDHGSELHLDLFSTENSDMRERMRILNAYYFPGKRYKALHQDITPVNSFRVVLNTFFGAKLGPLPDKSYFSTWTAPYDFVDVTDEAQRTETYRPEDEPADGPFFKGAALKPKPKAKRAAADSTGPPEADRPEAE